MKLYFFCIAGLVAAVVSAAENQARKWTDKSGSYSLQAEFVELAGDQVVLKREDGKSARVPLEKLSVADQEYVRQKTSPKPDNPFAVTGAPSVPQSKPSQKEDATAGASEDGGALREIVATGKGATEDEAKRDAFRNAVEQAVGVYVDATTIASNEKLIEDNVLTYSNAYIKSVAMMGSSAHNTVQTVKIRAMVKVQRLAEKLRSQGIKMVAVDGQSIAGEIITTNRMQEDGTTWLKMAIGDYPLSFVEFTPSGRFSPSEKGGLDTSIRYSVKPDAYRQYVAGLEKVLRLQATQSGSDVMPITSRGLGLRYEHFPKAVQQTILKLKLPAARDGKCFFIIGKSITQQPGNRDKRASLSVTWYLLEGQSASLPYKAWLRSRNLLVRCSLQDEAGISVIELPVRPCRQFATGEYQTFLTPGGAIGTGWSATGELGMGFELQNVGYPYNAALMVLLPGLVVPSSLADP